MNIEVSLSDTTRHRDGSAKLTVAVPEFESRRELDLSFGELHDRCGIPDNITLDLLLVASVCYVIDKTVKRARSFDGWTRDIEAQLPVSAPGKWQKVARGLNGALKFLTGDEWSLSFRDIEVDFFRAPEQRRRRKQRPPSPDDVSRVCLFSGGFDSLTGAIELLEHKGAGGLRLVGHYDAAGAASAQERLFKALDENYPRPLRPVADEGQPQTAQRRRKHAAEQVAAFHGVGRLRRARRWQTSPAVRARERVDCD